MSTTSLQIGYIERPMEAAAWPRLRSMLTPALKPGNLSWDDIEPAIAAGEMQVVAIRKERDPDLLACAVIRSALTREGEALEIVAAAGTNFREWAAWGMSALRKAARNAGMHSVQMVGRPGWRRIFPQIKMDGPVMVVDAHGR
ncbi:hypothetical protein [Sphingomonas beigongshangi]|uniref:hypothetical protein n=1 Tax=Sphingomonas beigongshangi TaxID=2782540 RepID=UPI00193C4AD9|nr:hypothetical protein [Sphingomonas beigongshangi]